MTDELETQIHDAYEALADKLGTEHQAQERFAHVVAQERNVASSTIGRRGFLSYLRWCIANPDHIVDQDEPECPCRGSGWIEREEAETRELVVVRCRKHAPPVNARPLVRVEEHRETAARGREQDESRYR